METHKGKTAYLGEQARTNRIWHKGLLASGGLISAVLASSCCILPLVLLSLGIGGAWMSNLTALEPYQPYFLLAALVMLGASFYNAYRKPNSACGTDGYCRTPLAERVIKVALWTATALVVLALAWPYAAPLFLG
ncbi:hypothetical protein LCGC14_0393470 [marine sediment metagenome]|uniref:Mercuric transport protein MerT n=3 Tax=root TaxID=1 RepID=A0A7V1BML8_9GAMM|nr:mercuric transporter MerT family protein [Marinobacter antarcticus]HDZ55300.1 mercury transporter MerT [Halopseudomonas xinjiangensis]HEA51688.1 mercury transporter MerT [Marinobacter antarcticus]